MKPQLSRTIDILHNELPHLLKHPLPAEILSPQISLVFFPSTATQEPTIVRGRFGYQTAFRIASWAAPFALSRKLRADVSLEILSERIIKLTQEDERLVVKWQAITDKSRHYTRSYYYPSGWFKFEFDERGYLVKHIIENVEDAEIRECVQSDLSVTEWLMGHRAEELVLRYKDHYGEQPSRHL